MDIIVTLVDIEAALDIADTSSHSRIVCLWNPELVCTVGDIIGTSFTAIDVNEEEFTVSVVTSVTLTDVTILGHVVNNTRGEWMAIVGIEGAYTFWVGFRITLITKTGGLVEQSVDTNFTLASITVVDTKLALVNIDATLGFFVNLLAVAN